MKKNDLNINGNETHIRSFNVTAFRGYSCSVMPRAEEECPDWC